MAVVYSNRDIRYINKRGQDPQAVLPYAISLEDYLDDDETVTAKEWLTSGIDTAIGPFIVDTDNTPVAIEDLAVEEEVNGEPMTYLRCERVWLKNTDFDGTTEEQDAWIGETGLITLRVTTDEPRVDDISFKLLCRRT